MSILTAAIYGRLVGDATLTADLALYRGSPAIFTAEAPEDAVLPYIVTAGDVGDAPFDSKTKIGRDVLRDVRCFAQDTHSSRLIERIAERVRTLLHRHKLVISGYATVFTVASGPIVNDADDIYGRVVTWRVVAVEGS